MELSPHSPDDEDTLDPQVRLICDRLEKEREQLLDLSGRNRLLNFRDLKARGLRIVGENADQVYTTLVVDGKSMDFAPASTSREEEDEDENTDHVRLAAYLIEELNLGENRPSAGRDNYDTTEVDQTDRTLQTPYDPATLDKRLMNTNQAAMSSIEEQGVNTLYLALGFLEWKDARASDRVYRAPLVLVPVSMTRGKAGRYVVNWTGDDIETNLSLAEKLRIDFGLSLPEWAGEADESTTTATSAATTAVTTDATVTSYFDAVRSIPGLDLGWGVSDDISLGFFWFSRFLIYKDLEPDKWKDKLKQGTGTIGKLLGDSGFTRENVRDYNERDDLDESLEADKIVHVVDADSSQMIAIRRVLDGNDLIVQGPPGTGKSQSITNVIAAAVAEGKKVLFLSEKRAALEVVYNNLDAVGIGRIALRLHSNRANKKLVLTDLEKTLSNSSRRRDKRDEVLGKLGRVRTSLNGYSIALTTTLDDIESTPLEVIHELSEAREQLGRVSAPSISRGEFEGVTLAELRDVTETTHQIEILLQGDVGVPDEHPFRGSGLNTVLPDDEAELVKAIGTARDQLNALCMRVDELRAYLNVGDRLTDLWHVARHVNEVADRPDIRDWSYSANAWREQHDVRMQILSDGESFNISYKKLGVRLSRTAWSKDVSADQETLNREKDSLFRWFKSDYRAARKRLRVLFGQKPPKGDDKWIEATQVVLDRQNLSSSIDATPAIGDVFGSTWDGINSDFRVLLAHVEPVMAIADAIEDGSLPDGSEPFFSNNDAIESAATLCEPLVGELGDAEDALSRVFQDLALDADVREGYQYDALATQIARLDGWIQDIKRLKDYVAFGGLHRSLLQPRQPGPNHEADGSPRRFDDLAEAAFSWPEAATHLSTLARYAWANDAFRVVVSRCPELQTFSRDVHEDAVNQFGRADTNLLATGRDRVLNAQATRLPTYHGGQTAVLRAEFHKKRRHLPVRQLMNRAAEAIQEIKPVFMMSPLSVATYLPAGRVAFDLVIFDEASQVRPVDAFGGILRADQAVVVGDTKQLPPTPFFEKLSDDEPLQADEEDESVYEGTSDLESVLGLFDARGCQSEMLTWHYRSRFESLIAVSNAAFYEDRLKTIPSPILDESPDGLSLRHLPDTYYEPGPSRRYNAGEAEAVTRAVVKHIREHPERSLGVAAFGSAQADRILEEIEQVRRVSPILDEFEKRHPNEPFFVKNLENVQGDERDVIFLSVGYGKTDDGHFRHQLGPINKQGGERRLNVIFTRARERCVVFANIRHVDIDTSRSQSRGVRILKRFLKYAETREIDEQIATGLPAESVFEEEVLDTLVRRGYRVETQVGSSGFRVDLAVMHPEHPSTYLLGIECDGARYHSTRWARARDRHRQQVLESKGWKIHRIWGPDWFRDPERETDRIEDLITRLLARERNSADRGDVGAANLHVASDLESTSHPPDDADGTDSYDLDGDDYDAEDVDVTANFNIPYVMWSGGSLLRGKDLSVVSTRVLGPLVVQLVAVESPIHVSEVARRLTAASGAGRAGSRIVANVERVIQSVQRADDVFVNGQFVWAGRPRYDIPVRDRSDLPASAKKIEYIPFEELVAALRTVIYYAVGMSDEDAIREASRILGFSRTSGGISARLQSVINNMVKRGWLERRDGWLQVVGGSLQGTAGGQASSNTTT